jgi:tRNA-Thr(GGU) m(6)t(6)A37 methyltransferase TsaA
MKIEYEAIGIVRSPYKEQQGTPIQPSRSDNAEGTVVIRQDLVEGLGDLDGFSHVILLCHLHKARPYRLKVIPYLDTEPRGLFATRAPSRPNPIGLSVVELLGISGNTLEVRGLDLLDGTPVLDIKPYVGEFDEHAQVRTGWLEQARKRSKVADDRFER